MSQVLTVSGEAPMGEYKAMAKIEWDLLTARGDQTGYATPPFLPKKPIPQLGVGRIDGERFHSRDFMEPEWRHIWTRTWQVAVHLSELPEAGSYRVHELGKESLLFVRGDAEDARTSNDPHPGAPWTYSPYARGCSQHCSPLIRRITADLALIIPNRSKSVCRGSL
jgi:hypothetical protein